MLIFILGLALFFSSHFFTAIMHPQRMAAAAKMGEGPFKGLFSIVALTGLALIIVGWPNADATLLYAPPYYFRHLTFAFMPVAMILLVAAYAPAGRIAAYTKHPMLAGVKIWAFAHLLSNGEIRSVLLFGLFLAFAVVDRIALKKRNAPVRAQGPVRNDVIAIVIGIGAYAMIVHYLHQYIAGVKLY